MNTETKYHTFEFNEDFHGVIKIGVKSNGKEFFVQAQDIVDLVAKHYVYPKQLAKIQKRQNNSDEIFGIGGAI